MAMTSAGTRGGGHVASKFDKRSGIKDGDIETFITKVDAVNAAIQGMKARQYLRDYERKITSKCIPNHGLHVQ